MNRITVTALAAIAGVLVALLATAALAHEGAIGIDCEQVEFSYTKFPDENANTIQETISVDGAEQTSTFVFDGSSGSHAVALDLTGSHTVTASAEWDTNGHEGSAGPVTKELDCGEDTGTTPTETTPTETPPTETTPTETNQTETTPTDEDTTTPVTDSQGPPPPSKAVELPYTGVPAWVFFLVGALSVVAGWAVRKAVR
jgi:hypothetical protein